MGCRCFFITKPDYDRFICLSTQSAEKEFLVLIKRKILMQKNCYLLLNLVAERQQWYKMYCANENIRDNKKWNIFSKKTLKSLHVSRQHFGLHGNPTEVHAHEVNPVDYAMASIIKAGAKIDRKIKAQETGRSFS